MSGCGELFYSDGEITRMLECYVFFLLYMNTLFMMAYTYKQMVNTITIE